MSYKSPPLPLMPYNEMMPICVAVGVFLVFVFATFSIHGKEIKSLESRIMQLEILGCPQIR